MSLPKWNAGPARERSALTYAPDELATLARSDPKRFAEVVAERRAVTTPKPVRIDTRTRHRGKLWSELTKAEQFALTQHDPSTAATMRREARIA